MKEQEIISKWLDVAGNKGKTMPAFPEDKKFKLSLSLILEELLEAAESGSKEQYQNFLETAQAVIEKKIKNNTNEKTEGDITELRDASADLRVVLGNLIHFSGLRTVFNEDLDEVMKSNFSKFCSTEEEAQETVALYGRGEHPNKMSEKIECIYEPVEEFFIIRKKDDGKILKSFKFKDAIFKN